MASIERSIQVGLGPMLANPTFFNKADLGTTPFKAVAASEKVRNLIICVVSANNVAWATVDRGATAPSITAAGAGAATEGALLVGGNGLTVNIALGPHKDLYLVASAASTIVNITIIEA